MSKSSFVSSKVLCACVAVAAGAWLLTSCADTYDDNDKFSSSVKNTQLSSPAEGDITITPNTDGDRMTIAWPVVHGAGGYEVTLWDLGNDSEPLVNMLVDGCSFTTDREEDVNYKLVIRTMGNSKLNNTDAASATEKLFNSFEASYAAIPEGDLCAWFAANPIPEDAVGENLNFDLIQELKSVGRLGWINGNGFSPYVKDLVFDGNENFRSFFQSVCGYS